MSSQLNIDVLGIVGSWQKAVGKNAKSRISSKIVKTGNMAGSFRDLTVYKKAYALAIEEGYRKRKYRNIANCFLPTANLKFAT